MRRHDPFRVNKDEFLEKLYKIHKDASPTELDMDDMAAGKMMATKALLQQGVVLTTKETADLMGEMVHVIKGGTSIAQRQVKEMLERQKRSKRAATYVRKNQASVKAMLERKK
jgi:hypothetical protein